ncbi:uncharacterized protein NECHADRAFT_86785 [Fusarium vanettenii 77-13-4]|uniref:Uncharacterized protein n=1 Tax=Fusarium vanettenii (strain ATCC MYA-4622 / CBS 123669 / FGSC 9596 / NRRL 45880 / 77-13-4) TaxID=660122 RepID=C7ZK23_FUSV7|nr:uncharacterized protein NECHADRAFT_86785 [Fusarium vanettenii 77-13-4]EEU35604.1 hypothetical protein NECHADRAFT_86785 [Fusarium vanettenii 77-13-4]
MPKNEAQQPLCMSATRPECEFSRRRNSEKLIFRSDLKAYRCMQEDAKEKYWLSGASLICVSLSFPSKTPTKLGPSLVSVTESPGWNGLKDLGACVSGRLGQYSRPGMPDHRPGKRDNDASIIEIYLGPIIRANYSVTDLTQEAFKRMDDTALNLLRSLNSIVNLQLITTERPPIDIHDVPGTTHAEDNHLAELRSSVGRMARLGAGFEQLHHLTSFLVSPSTLGDQRELSLGTGKYPLFTLPPGDTGDLAIGCLRRWHEILKTLPGGSPTFEDLSFYPSEATEESTENYEWNERRGEHVGSIVKVITDEFRRLSCVKERRHEILLQVSNDLPATRPDNPPKLDMFISRCPTSNLIWQESQCGDFDAKISGKEKCMCEGIKQAMKDRKKLHLLVDHRGVIDVTDSVKPAPLRRDSFDGISLSELLRQDVFGPIDTQAWFNNTAARKVNSATKAQVALGLSRCLMDFFDKGLELASHSWTAENVHFRESSDSNREGMQRLLYVSLRPKLDQARSADINKMLDNDDINKMFDSDNPVVLSFAKLLLEIFDGKAISIQRIPTGEEKLWNWLDLGDVVENLLQDQSRGSFAFKYLEVVESCLRLRATLRDCKSRSDLVATSRFVRKTIYENVVRKLEVLASWERKIHGQRKRKNQDPVLDEPPTKKLAVLPQSPDAPRAPGQAGGHDPGLSASNSGECTAVEEEFTEHTEEGEGGPSLYDDQGEADQSDRVRAKEYLRKLSQGFNRRIKPLKDSAANEIDPIKVAIIDSGVDLDDPVIRARSCQIGDKRNWTSDQPDACADDCGHGTHVTRLILEAAPAVKVYVAKVTERKKLDSKVSGRIRQAIEWATGVWEVDIISLSFAMDGEDETIRATLDKVLNPPRHITKNVIVIAAASNWGGNRHIGFPACYEDIICVHSTDGYGNPSKTNPTARKGKDFSTLGMSIKSSFKGKGKDKRRSEVYISGTSYATAIGAGITANILDFARRDPKLRDEEKWWLFSSCGMSCVLRSMSEERGGYRYVMPWALFDGRDEKDIWRDIRGALKSR